MDIIDFWTICSTNGIVLDREQQRNFERYHDELVIWNDKVNLISRQDVENIYVHHFLHSVAILKYAEIPKKARCLDVGTGGGFPGIPLKIARPDIWMLLVDSIAKKMKITGMFAQHTGLRNIEAKTIRAEALADNPAFRRAFDVITARAVAQLVQLLTWIEPLLKQDGQFITLKGGDLEWEIAEAKKKFPTLEVSEHPIQILGEEWFERENKKVLICRFTAPKKLG